MAKSKKDLEPIMQKGYGTIPKSVILTDELSRLEKFVFFIICAYAGKKRVAYPSIKNVIAPACGSNPHTVTKAINHLGELGYISVIRIKGRAHKFFINYKKRPPIPRESHKGNIEILENIDSLTSIDDISKVIFVHWHKQTILPNCDYDEFINNIDYDIVDKLHRYGARGIINEIDGYVRILHSDDPSKKGRYDQIYSLIGFLLKGIDEVDYEYVEDEYVDVQTDKKFYDELEEDNSDSDFDSIPF
jgi:DNA-binding transcriptional regulator YhcF (GntR family)